MYIFWNTSTFSAKEQYIITLKFKHDDVLLFGRESAGVPEDVHSKVNERIKIPMLKNKRSLNIAISVAIGVSEFIRQIG